MPIRYPRSKRQPFAVSNIFLLCILLVTIVSCQRELGDGNPKPQDPDGTDPNGAWVLKSRYAKGFGTTYGHLPYNNTISFIYDWYSRMIIVRDTNNDNKFTAQYLYRYNDQGRVVNISDDGTFILKQERSLTYNAQGLLSNIVFQELPLPGFRHEGQFQWVQQDGQPITKFSNPDMPGSPYADGNRQFGLNDRQLLIHRIQFSNDPVYDDEKMEVLRDAKQNVTVRKHFFRQHNSWTISDSIVYTRETTRPPRISNFFAMLSNGVTWFGHPQGITYMPVIHYNSDYFEYDNDLANKVVYFARTVPGGALVKTHDVTLVTTYDTNGNPIKQTVTRDGEKEVEITFEWQKVKWLN